MREYHYSMTIGGLPVLVITPEDPLHFVGLWRDPMILDVVRGVKKEVKEVPDVV